MELQGMRALRPQCSSISVENAHESVGVAEVRIITRGDSEICNVPLYLICGIKKVGVFRSKPQKAGVFRSKVSSDSRKKLPKSIIE